MPESRAARPAVALLTLGCAKNLVDSEQIASLLEGAGARVVHELTGARVAIVNTCGFIESAKQEAVDLVLEVGAAKTPEQDGAGLKTLIVTGCLGQRYGAELAELIPEVDAVVGVDPRQTAEVALRALGLAGRPLPSGLVLRHRRMTPRAWSYLHISHGCDNCCSYCAIPLIRGPMRSRPYDELLTEARFLADQGVRELNVIAQDTAAYGLDTDGRPRIGELLQDLCAIDALAWVRLLYVHPAHVSDELMDVLAGEERICAYLDMPLQHVGDRILAQMGRRVTRADTERLITRLRERIPGLTLRTTFMTGFPGETDEEFEELLAFVEDVRFDRLGCFAYSPEEGTRAAALPHQVDAELAAERCAHVMAVQQGIAFELAQQRVGQEVPVLVEEADANAEGLVPGRSPAEAPDVDPLIYLAGDPPPEPGRIVRARIVGALGYDCIAELIDAEAACAEEAPG